MSCTLCNILIALKRISGNAKIAGEALGMDHVTIGYVDPPKARDKPKVMLWWSGDIDDDIDDYEQHTVRVMLGVLSKHDPSDPTQHDEDLLQATEVYFAVRAEWMKASRDLTGSGLGTGKDGAGALILRTSAGGSEPDGFSDKDRATFVGQFFDVIFKQPLPA